LASPFLKSKSKEASVGCSGQTNAINGCPIFQLKEPATEDFLPNTSVNLQKSSGVHASTAQGSFCIKRGTNIRLDGWSSCYAWGSCRVTLFISTFLAILKVKTILVFRMKALVYEKN